jgi:pimeloyl-ACP methyl ester carboxylesterase
MNNLKSRLLLLLLTFSLTPFALGAGQQKPGDLKIETYVFEAANKQKINAESGRLVVPENRNNPRSNLIEIAFVRFKSTAKEPGPPIVYLEGGPGGSGIDAAGNQAFSLLMAMRELGDVIVLDQRASGKSRPNLECSQTWDRPLDVPGESKETLPIVKEKIRVCLQELRNKGIDPAGYNTNENADDIEDLRRALGYPKIRLWGISYGTLLALIALRRHNNSIDRLILSGVLGPSHARAYFPSLIQEQLVKVDSLFKADPNVNKLMPDFQGLVKSLLNQLDKSPVVVEVDDPQTKQRVKVAVNKFDLQLFTAYSLTYSYGIMNLPNFYYPMSKGDWTPLARRALSRRREQVGPMLALLMTCASGMSDGRKKRIEAEAKQGFLLGTPSIQVVARYAKLWEMILEKSSVRR